MPTFAKGPSLATIGAWSARHRTIVLAGWVVLLIAATAGHRIAGSSYSDSLTIPDSQAQTGADLLKAHDARAGGVGGQIVFSDPSASLSSQRQAIEQATANLAALPHVVSVADPLSAQTTSADGRTAYAPISFSTNPQSLGSAYVASVDRAMAPLNATGVHVSYGGAIGQAETPRGGDSRSELIGIVVALLVLLFGFGSILAAVTPLLSAILGIVTGIGTLGVVAAGVSFGTDAPTLGTMMGLGVGIDYALFLTTRHRQLLIDGLSPIEAVRRTMNASGRSVLLAASTVIVAMLGLYASGISFIGNLGLAAAIAVAVAALAALTLVPALLGFAGRRIDRLHVRRPQAEPANEHSPLHRYTAFVARHPWRVAVGAIAVLLVVAIPALSMQFGHVGAGAEPKSTTERQAYDAISQGFGAGANGPLTVVVSLPPGETAAQTQKLSETLTTQLRAAGDVERVSAVTPSQDGRVLTAKLIPDSGPQSTATTSLVDTLQNQTLPHALAGSGATGYVSGTTAATIDFETTVSSRLPIIIGIVILAAFVLLLSAFRSPVLALKAALLNLLSIGATYGILVAAFQWGWASGLLGFSGSVPIESYVPMIVFAIVFGLSMDYEVFLISRIREHWLAGESNQQAVAHGLAQTARVITCAAVILASVFFAFLLSSNLTIKMLALGLGASVLIDATVIRLMIVPALMFVFEDANWWTPAWLGRRPRRLQTELGR